MKAVKRKKKKTTTTNARAVAKFAGQVKITPPAGEQALPNGTRVVVSLAELSFAKIPEFGKKSELKLEMRVQTTAKDGKAVSKDYAPGLFYYVLDNSKLNLLNTVLYDGVIHQHLSLDTEITEVETPQMKAPDVAALAKAGLDALGPAAGLSGGAAAVVGAIPAVVGGILKLNGNDQVLKFGASLFTREVSAAAEAQPLLAGLYTIAKFKAGNGKPWVTMKIMVTKVS